MTKSITAPAEVRRETRAVPKEARRVQLDFTADRIAELSRLMEECGIKTRVDLINTALTVLEWAISERKTGRIIASVDESNMRYKELVIPAFSAVRAAAQRQAERAGR
jgi:hypothetical protein